MTNIKLDQIRTDGGTQFRVELDEDTVENYADLMKDGVEFPPVTVFEDEDGVYWLADGFHRVAAAEQAELEAINADVRIGSHRDAVLYSLGANRDHGLYRSNDDKRKAVVFCLRDPELREKSQREIARLCGVTQAMVSKVNSELFPKPPKAESDNRYRFETAEDVVKAMSEDERNEFLLYISRGYIWANKYRDQFQLYGLLTAFPGFTEKTPLADVVFELLSKDDQWLRLEFELRQWNSERDKPLHLYSDVGDVKSALELLYQSAGWVNVSDIGSGAIRYWVKLFCEKGWAKAHEINDDEQRISTTFYHITPEGCQQLGLPFSLQMKPGPTVHEVVAEQKSALEKQKQERREREQERLSTLNADEEATRERSNMTDWYLSTLKRHAETSKWLDPEAMRIASTLLEQFREVVMTAETYDCRMQS